MEVILLWILSTFIVSAHGRPFQTIGIATRRARESETRPRCFWPFTLIPKLFKSQETRDTLGQQEVPTQNYGQPSGQVPGMAHPFLANPEVGPVVGRLEPQPPISIGPAPLHYQTPFFGSAAVGQMQPLPIGPAPPNYAAAGPYNPQPVRLPGPMLGTPCFMPQQNPLPTGTMWVPCPAALQAMQNQQLLLPQPAPLKRSQRA